MHVGVVGKPSTLRIRRNISQLILEIRAITHAVFVKARLPDCSAKLFSNPMGKAAFNALRATLNSLLTGRR